MIYKKNQVNRIIQTFFGDTKMQIDLLSKIIVPDNTSWNKLSMDEESDDKYVGPQKVKFLSKYFNSLGNMEHDLSKEGLGSFERILQSL